MTEYELDIEVTRGDLVESRHRVHAAVVNGRQELIGAARDASLVTYWRSCAKPFQVMPLIASGGFDRVGWGDDELALACGSHGGEPEHVAIAGSMLADIGLEEGDLACGAHEPLSPRGARLVRESGARLTRMHNNCSGKHAAMLARAHTEGWSVYGYERDEHGVQRDVLAEVGRWTGIPARRIRRAVDGCGVVCMALPLVNMACAFSRLARAAAAEEEIPARVVHAMRSRPFLVGGTDRFDTVLMEVAEGRILSKIGAEGMHSIGLLDSGIGIALKVEDGAPRAQYAAILRLLQMLGAVGDPLPEALAEFATRPIRNSRGERVGEVRPAA